MAQLFIITANYGMYEDYREVELFATADKAEADAKFASLQTEFVGVFGEMLERTIANGSWDYGPLLASEAIVTVANAVWHEEGFSLCLHEMAFGQLTVGKVRLKAEYIPFVTDDPISFEDVIEGGNAYDAMAANYEEKWLD
jgi:hypothetical protein